MSRVTVIGGRSEATNQTKRSRLVTKKWSTQGRPEYLRHGMPTGTVVKNLVLAHLFEQSEYEQRESGFLSDAGQTREGRVQFDREIRVRGRTIIHWIYYHQPGPRGTGGSDGGALFQRKLKTESSHEEAE